MAQPPIVFGTASVLQAPGLEPGIVGLAATQARRAAAEAPGLEPGIVGLVARPV